MAGFEQMLKSYQRTVGATAGEPFCHAPLVNLHFSHGGNVLACCFNRTHILGTYPAESVKEIWTGEKLQQLRRAMVDNDLSKGCQSCMRQLIAGDIVGLADMTGFYRQKWLSEHWQSSGTSDAKIESFHRAPFMLEFELHNTCNLQCVMCNGLVSSSIQKHRNALPALPSPYDTQFVDQLAEFLPEVAVAGFTGGEPFLIPVYHEIWDRIAECNPGMLLTVVTNGTILTDRVRGLVEKLNFLINVSIDSIVKETYESIRQGANFDKVMENSLYFADLMQKRGKPFMWRCCVMRQNWREIPEMVRFCDDKGIQLVFNQVEYPLDFSLHTLPPSEQQKIGDFLSKADTFQASNPVQAFNHQQYRGLVQRITSLAEPENWRNSFLDRLEMATHNPILDDVSTQAVGFSSSTASDAFAEKVSNYVATRLTIDQAIEATGGNLISQTTGDTLSQQRSAVAGFRSEIPLNDFVQVFLNVCLRTFIKVMGVRADHSPQLFRKIDQLVQSINERPQREAIVDGILDCPPAEIYEQIDRQEPGEVESWFNRLQHKTAGPIGNMAR